MINLTPEQAERLYDFIGETPPKEISEGDISRVITEIERLLLPFTSQCRNIDGLNIQYNKNILVVDDLEVSLFQLSKLLAKSGYNAYVSRTRVEAEDMFKKLNFDYVFLDLFLPEAENGLELLQKLKNSDKAISNKTRIIVISGTEDNTLINECFERGADEFIGKTKYWHMTVLEKLRNFNEINRGPSPEIKTIIEDEEHKIALIKIRNILKQGVLDELKREAINLSLLGYKRLILDMENLHSPSQELLNTIVFIYKHYDSAGGRVNLCNLSNKINEAFSYIFLDGVIPVFKDREAALNDFYERFNNC